MESALSNHHQIPHVRPGLGIRPGNCSWDFFRNSKLTMVLGHALAGSGTPRNMRSADCRYLVARFNTCGYLWIFYQFACFFDQIAVTSSVPRNSHTAVVGTISPAQSAFEESSWRMLCVTHCVEIGVSASLQGFVLSSQVLYHQAKKLSKYCTARYRFILKFSHFFLPLDLAWFWHEQCREDSLATLRFCESVKQVGKVKSTHRRLAGLATDAGRQFHIFHTVVSQNWRELLPKGIFSGKTEKDGFWWFLNQGFPVKVFLKPPLGFCWRMLFNVFLFSHW